MIQEFYIKEVDWSTHEAALRLIRQEVFIVEQHVPDMLEWDMLDADATHLIVMSLQEKALGCARVLNNGRVGRMAIIKKMRGHGLGKALLKRAIQVCKKRQLKKVELSAQAHAIKFYEKYGFVMSSEPYLDANIWHVDMQLNI